MANTKVRIAILDLYDNEPNQGMRCIKELILTCDESLPNVSVGYDVFDVRYKGEVPGLDFDIYLSSGGPGSPFDGKGTVWEQQYFNLIDGVWNHNQRMNVRKKHVFFICHSFQMMCRFFKLATVRRREMQSFGILPVDKTSWGNEDILTRYLPETYYAADFREFEVVEPDSAAMSDLGAQVLSKEHMRRSPHLEKALMAIRVSDEMVGTQYHPEADPIAMLYHFRRPERKRQVVDEHGEEKYHEMISHLEDPGNILLTREMVLPKFLMNSIRRLYPELHV